MNDQEILARTIYGEARGEYKLANGGMASLVAVGNVVMNRLHAQSWFGQTVMQVCKKPWQFSCWNKSDPNYIILTQLTIDDPVFEICMLVARNLMKNQWPDLTNGANHYHSKQMIDKPSWAVHYYPCFEIGRHLFYNIRG